VTKKKSFVAFKTAQKCFEILSVFDAFLAEKRKEKIENELLKFA
jgi:hypothetical protein